MKARLLCPLTGLALAAVLASCSTTKPPAESYRGTMRSSCAPHDARSTELRLESIEGPGWVWFNLWPEGGVTAPTVVRFDRDRPIGQASYCGDETCEPAEAAEWGEVVLLASDSGAAEVRGNWTLGMPDGQVHSGTFEAAWLGIQAMCG